MGFHDLRSPGLGFEDIAFGGLGSTAADSRVGKQPSTHSSWYRSSVRRPTEEFIDVDERKSGVSSGRERHDNDGSESVFNQRQHRDRFGQDYRRQDSKRPRGSRVKTEPRQSTQKVNAEAPEGIRGSEALDEFDMIIKAKPPVNYYEVLNIQKRSAKEYSAMTVEEYVFVHRRSWIGPPWLISHRIRKAAKLQKIATHPDRLLRNEASEAKAKEINLRASEVGEAAEILLNIVSVSARWQSETDN